MIQVLDAKNRILGVEHPDTINAMENLAATYQYMGQYTEAEKLEMQVLDARNRILGVQHPQTITAMMNLAATYKCLGRHTEGEKLQIEAQEAQSRVFAGEHFQKINTMSNVQESQESQVLDARSMLPDTIMNPGKKGVK